VKCTEQIACVVRVAAGTARSVGKHVEAAAISRRRCDELEIFLREMCFDNTSPMPEFGFISLKGCSGTILMNDC
jgi:hypothetical protein